MTQNFDAGEAKARELAAPIAAASGFTVDEILGEGRTAGVAAARHQLIVVLWRTTGMSTTEVGRAVGGRDHTTVIAALRKVLGRDGYEKEAAARRKGKPFAPPALAPLKKTTPLMEEHLQSIESRLGRIEAHLALGGRTQ